MRLQRLFEDDDETKDLNSDAIEAWLSKPDSAQRKPKRYRKPSKLTDTGGIVGTPVRLPPEYLRSVKKGERFGGEPVATELINPMPPFPYHPEKNQIKDPEAQIYWTIKTLGPLSWKDVRSKIAPYLKKMRIADRDLPSKEDYVAAMTKLLKKQVVHKVDDGRYAAF